ncbi:DMT family transporter [Desulfovibrio sp. MES5]|uniref:DMT family transporter n=1 Tax=Desulfovibrio sp. MES5 TaxID=1899016 RepID=UPI0025C73EE9|nr:DMT family transporter [Desulfovibrio sp. MES5]
MTSAGSRSNGARQNGMALTAGITLVCMIFFAANSLLCRMALFGTGMDAVSYTVLRSVSAAAVLWLLTRLRGERALQFGSWSAALALFSYMACFSWAYVNLSAAAGALIIAVAVQTSMVGAGVALGQRPSRAQALGITLAMAGLVYLLLPGLDAPPLWPSAIIFLSGASWAVYTLLGRRNSAPVAATAGNFVRCLPLALLFLPLAWLEHAGAGGVAWGGGPTLPFAGVLCALVAGGIASALGYVLWYSVLPRLSVPTAAVVQLSVPLITALGGALFMGEALTLRLGISTAAILGGIFCATVLAAVHKS